MKLFFFHVSHLTNLVFGIKLLTTSSFISINPIPITFRAHDLTTSNTPLLSSSAEKGELSAEISQESSTSKQDPKNTKLTKDDDTPIFWKLDDDRFIVNVNAASSIYDNSEFLDDMDSSVVKSIQFTVRGKARPLQRHRSVRGFTYNPSAKAQSSFSSVVISMIDSFATSKTPHTENKNKTKKNTNNEPNYNTPFFQSNEFLKMKLRFRLPRPKHHFRNKSTILKPTSPKKYSPQLLGKGDIDNLAKFVLDSLNGVIYDDDKQIVSLSCSKIYDFEGPRCDGAIDVFVERVHDDDLDEDGLFR